MEKIIGSPQEIEREELSEGMTIPDVLSFRKVVDRIQDRRDSVLIKVLYLIAGRTSEICTKVGAYDLSHNKSRDYGTFMNFTIENFVQGSINEKVLLIKVATAKRRSKDGKIFPRYIAVPVNPTYEPWCKDLLEWIRDKGNLNFPLLRWTVSLICKKNLRVLGEDIHAHSLRHIRVSHLINNYGFEPPEVTSVCGWTFRTGWDLAGFQTNPMISIYLHTAWKKSFPRLCKPLSEVIKIG